MKESPSPDGNAVPSERSPEIRVGDLGFLGKHYRYIVLPGPPQLPELTPAERHVAELAALGETARSIARTRRTSVRTVEGQLANVFRKLNISGRSELCEQMFSTKA